MSEDPSKTKNKTGLRQNIEIQQDQPASQSLAHPEDFVTPLLQEISKGATLPAFDLSDPDSASRAAAELQGKLEQLLGYQDRTRKLNSCLKTESTP